MVKHSLSVAALAAVVVAAASPASAGPPCCCPAPCAVPVAPMMVYQPYEIPRVYIVNQGPVFSGPGIYTRPEVVVPRVKPYPYVRYDYPVYRDAGAYPVRKYYRHRYVRSGRALRPPPGWFDK